MNTEKKERTYSEPFLVQMVSGNYFEHCDVYPFGSIHEVRKCNEGFLWSTNRVHHAINTEFKTSVLQFKPETKTCGNCRNDFPNGWAFIRDGELNSEVCVRCYEKRNHVNREEYREVIRQEIKLQYGIK